jgi:hypothetical protein
MMKPFIRAMVFLMSMTITAARIDPQTLPYGLLYAKTGQSVTIIKYTGKAAALVIPDQIEVLPVTKIGGWAFEDCANLRSVTIPSSVTEIGTHAFWRCSGLTSVIIPPSVTVIGELGFSGCTSLTSITIPSSVIYLGDRAFFECISLQSVTLSRRTQVGYRVFPDGVQITYRE